MIFLEEWRGGDYDATKCEYMIRGNEIHYQFQKDETGAQIIMAKNGDNPL